MKFIRISTLVTVTVATMLAPADPALADRQQLEEVVFYHRLVEGGSRLALVTYQLQQQAFREAKRPKLARAAAFFQTLAALELRDRQAASEIIGSHPWNGDSDWEAAAAELKRVLDAFPESSDAISSAGKRVIAATDPSWRDPSPDLSDLPWDQRNAAAAWALSGQAELLSADDDVLSLQPVLTITASGKVEVDYPFFDPMIFRAGAVRRAQELLDSIGQPNDAENFLLRLWCEILLHRNEHAQSTVQSLKQLALDSKLNSDQIEELQCLGAALAGKLGQNEQVESFLQSRLENPPTSPWALRAMNLLSGFAKLNMEVMNQTVASYAQNHHPFARQVLTNIPTQTERVLDCYWEVVWAHRRLAVEGAHAAVGTPANTSALRARRLVEELASPTVAEAWRPMSVLRLESVFEANVLAGDAETWQLALRDDQLQQYPIFEPIVQLSRAYSGQQRTRVRKGDIDSLAGEVTKDVAHLLLGDEQAALIEPAGDAGDVAGEGFPLRGWIVLLVAMMVIILLVVLVRTGRKGSA